LSSTNRPLRLRIFAGPNGSGKSAIVEAVRNHKVRGIPIDFGIYINADDIAKALREKSFSFKNYKVTVGNDEFVAHALSSGLINKDFPASKFKKSYKLGDNKIELKDAKTDERLAQLIADFLRKKLLQEKKKFSFETVFSHPSKLNIIKEATTAGYKVYLYFVSTENPKINKYRIKLRVQKGGHSVPEDKIEQRYYRSLELLYEAAQHTYQSFFFDNSPDGQDFKPFAHFKKIKGRKKWDYMDSEFPDWFVKYYSNKIKKK